MRFCLGISVYTAAAVAAICAAPSHSASAQDADAKPVSIDVLDVASMTVPATFKKTQPRSRIIQHEFKVGEGEKPARLTFMAAGGGVTPNIKRWKGQFSGGDPDDLCGQRSNADPWPDGKWAKDNAHRPEGHARHRALRPRADPVSADTHDRDLCVGVALCLAPIRRTRRCLSVSKCAQN